MRHMPVALLIICMACSSPASSDDASPQQNADQQSREQPERRDSIDTDTPAQMLQRWQTMDTNGDQKISRDEARGPMRANFDRVDADSDGLIDRSELQALAQRLSGNQNRQRQQNNRNRNQQANRNRNQQTISTDQLLQRAPEGVTVVPDIAYREGHERWKLDLAVPTAPADKPRPAIVFIHGGGWRSGDKRRESFLNPALEYAADGYVTITVNYRLLNDVPITGCIEDVKCAVRWLRAHAEEYGIDPERIGATGNSAGAHLSAMLGVCPKSAGLEGDGPWQEHSSMVQAVCCSATPTSFLIPMNNRARQAQSRGQSDSDRPRQNGNDPEDSRRQDQSNSAYSLPEETRRQVSPITYVSADAPPFLLVHEVSDGTVNVEQSDRFVAALREAGAKDIKYMRYEDGTGHGTFQANIKETGPARKAFFDRVLRPKKATSSD